MDPRAWLIVIGVFLAAAGAAGADVIILKNGRTIEAERVWEADGQIQYEKFGAVVGVPADQVERVERKPMTEAPSEPAPAPSSPDPDPGIIDRTTEAVRSVIAPRSERAETPRSEPAATPRSERAETPRAGKPMTIQALIADLERVPPLYLLIAFLAPPLITWVFSLTHGQGAAMRSPLKYIYSALVYLVCVPGILAGVLVAYSVFFIRQNLLTVNVFVYFLPVLAMIGTLIIIGRKVSWHRLPGVDRLSALITILVITFGATLAIQKTRIWIFFGGSVKLLILIAIICFVLLKLSTRKLVGRR